MLSTADIKTYPYPSPRGGIPDVEELLLPLVDELEDSPIPSKKGAEYDKMVIGAVLS